jgi:hypothetical protein
VKTGLRSNLILWLGVSPSPPDEMRLRHLLVGSDMMVCRSLAASNTRHTDVQQLRRYK